MNQILKSGRASDVGFSSKPPNPSSPFDLCIGEANFCSAASRFGGALGVLWKKGETLNAKVARRPLRTMPSELLTAVKSTSLLTWLEFIIKNWPKLKAKIKWIKRDISSKGTIPGKYSRPGDSLISQSVKMKESYTLVLSKTKRNGKMFILDCHERPLYMD